ncbi:MAG TPA: flagellar motor protein MotB [candidate division Zixibacteria bacterium]|nr:flagellar motor protein MotB [candidate division Zixibacteria bacterium]MDD4917134.1 flagellar motor protein MotB [candidate division Zixibacteria bacterium]MDM7972682.1 flagellar motor protein MotB [candidate division Zixibacteria bacterium]HOD65402.1 flagellar motor protein MotB [candidate division Zixibacteria bacterium]HQL22942.1 flagellar motor protein MotB [candidate division Zixibacteria bacterium]
MRRFRRRVEDKENLDRWLLTYSDLITLLLAFFVVMYSMSQVDAKRFGQMAKALHGILKGGENVFDYDEAKPTEDGHGLLKLGNLRMLQARVEERFKGINRLDDVSSEITERGLVIHIVDRALFDEGAADLKPQAIDVLDLINDEVRAMPNHLRIEGHTDDRQIATLRFPSNWELSAARATEVVRFFVNQHDFPPDRISALGYGEFRPIRPNNSIENRAMNRRVDIVILTMELSLKEPTSQLYFTAANE